MLNRKPLKKRRSCKEGDKITIGKTTLVLSEKPVGDIIEQTAVDVVADMQQKEFGRLMDSASVDVVKAYAEHHRQPTGLKKILGGLFGKR